MTPETPGAPEPDAATVATLVTEAAELRETIVGLRTDMQASERRSAVALKAEKSKRRRSQRWLLAAVAVDVAFTITLATVLSGQAHTNAQLKAATAQIQESLRRSYATTQQQAQIRTQVLCPLYGVLVAFTDDPARTVGLTPAQKLRSDNAVAVVEKGYETLGCQPAVAGQGKR